jgi:serralysin
LGSDLLNGGAGTDSFVFNTALSLRNVDRIADFLAIDDTIRLESAVFTQLLSTGTLAASMFQASGVGAADDADDYIVYNTTTGSLSYDADGVGATAAVQFAQLVGSPAITNADFVVV